MRKMLRDAEETPPPAGWERLGRELGEPAPRRMFLHRYWPQAAAVAAVLLIVAGTWEFFPRRVVNDDLKEGFVITAAGDGGSAADSTARSDGFAALAETMPAGIAGKGAPAARPAARQPSEAQQQRNATVAASGEQLLLSAAGAELQPDAGRQPDPAEQPRQPDSRPAEAAPERAFGSAVYPDEKFVAYVPARKKASFGLFGSGSLAGSPSGGGAPRVLMADMVLTGANGEVFVKQQADYEQSSFRHYQPLSFGLSARKEFARGLSLESGVVYTFLRSDVRLPFSSEDVSQKLHFIGVPLRLNWRFYQSGPFQLYIGAGGMAEKCIYAKFGSESRDEPGLQWSALGVAGAQYDLGGTVGLYFEPEVSYYFNDTRLRTDRTDNPLTFTFRLGVRLSF